MPGRRNPSRAAPARPCDMGPPCMIRSSRPRKGGRPSGSRSTAPKSRTPSRPSASSRKLPGCGSACSRPARAGPENRNRATAPARSRLGLLPSAMIGDSGVPSIHSVTNTWPVADDVRDEDVGVVAVRQRERSLRGGLQRVVELLGHPGPQLGEQRLDVEARHERAEQPRQPASWLRSPISAWPAPGYCIFTATSRPSAQTARCTCPIDAAAAGCRRTTVTCPPLPPELPGQHLVHGPRGHRRGGLLQLRQRLPVGARDLLGQRRLEDRHRLAELHRAALELAQHPEDLLGGAELDFPGDGLGGRPPTRLPTPRAVRPPEGQRGQLGRPGH